MHGIVVASAPAIHVRPKKYIYLHIFILLDVCNVTLPFLYIPADDPHT